MSRLVGVVFVLLSLLSLQASSASTGEDEATRLLLVAGDEALGKGRSQYQAALAKYTEALVRSPESERGLYSRAELLSLLHERARAMADLDKLLLLSPTHARALKLRMSMRAYEGNLVAALEDGKRLVKAYKDQKKTKLGNEAAAKVNLLAQYSTVWQQISSVVNTPPGMESDESDPALQSKYESCVSVLEKVIRDFAPDSIDLRLRRASCALSNNNNQVTTSEIKYILKLDPHNLVAISINARALRRLGALEQAKSELRRCLTIDPEYAPCAKQHKLVRSQQKHTANIEKALAAHDYTKVLQHIQAAYRDEKNPPYKEQLLLWECDGHVGARDPTKGLKACQAALSTIGADTPAAADIHLQIAELYIMDDDLDKAEGAAHKARELTPRSAKVDDLLQKIEKLRRTGARKDYYKILGVKKSASSQDIRRAYRKLAKTHHPDQHRSKDMPDAEREKLDKLFRDINEAKEVLLDEEKRSRYDAGEDVMNPQAQAQGQQFHGFHSGGGGFPGGGFGGFPGGFGGFQFHGGGGQQFFFRQG